MSEKDLYEILGVAKGADIKDIKKSYRRLAMKYHPDRNAGDKQAEEKFKEISGAYEVLSDEQKRQTYDQFGHAGINQGAGNHGGFGGGFGGVDLNDIFGSSFGDMFGGGQSRRRSQGSKGSDLAYELQLTLEEAANGTTVNINIPTRTTCSSCSGSGAEKGYKPQVCATCGGTGQTSFQQGFLSVQRTCTACHGSGTVITHPCKRCHGVGTIKDTKKLAVNIPPGVDTGDRISLRGKGEAGSRGGRDGDLYVDIIIKKHEIFQRKGADLYCEIPVSFPDAVLGGEVEVPTLSGSVKLKIPAGTQNGKLFRLRGKGVRTVHSNVKGSVMCRIFIETPVNLDNSQKELLVKLKETLSGKTCSPHKESWVKKVSNFFDNLK